jgi:two-component system response regulator FixJ
MTMLRSQTAPGRTVLLVDDDDGSRSALTFLLEAAGFTVRSYCRPEQLLDEGEMPCDGCLVTDYNMPGMNGLQLVSALRSKGVSMPALLVTGDPNRAVRDDAAAAGVPIIDKLNATVSLIGQISGAVRAPVSREAA